jgi:D-glycero-D-manno-heptose 1,7-bisphosphate phosphatase
VIFAGRPEAVFLDRDGTINEKAAEGDYIKSPAELRVFPSAAEAIRRLNDACIPVIVVTNQRGIALGIFSEDDLEEIHAALQDRLRQLAGARIDAFFHCPHDLGQCDCRKPGTGLFRQAQRSFPELNRSRAVMIGDAPSDVEAGRGAGMTALQLGVDTPDLFAAVNELLATAPAR